MNNIKLLFLFILFLPIAHFIQIHPSQNQLPQTQWPYPVYPNVNFLVGGGNAHANVDHSAPVLQNLNAQMTAQAQATQISEYTIHHVFKFPLEEKIATAANNIKEKGSNSFFASLDCLTKHKLKTIAIILLSCYAYIYYQISKTNAIISNSHSWCNWKQAVALIHLTSTNKDELLTELLHDIQRLYFFSPQSTSQTPSFDQLIQSLQYEKTQLKQYKSLLYWSQKCYLANWLPFHYNLEILTEKIARLDFVIELYALWQSNKYFATQ